MVQGGPDLLRNIRFVAEVKGENVESHISKSRCGNPAIGEGPEPKIMRDKRKER
jgi:hypothetical protein